MNFSFAKFTWIGNLFIYLHRIKNNMHGDTFYRVHRKLPEKADGRNIGARFVLVKTRRRFVRRLRKCNKHLETFGFGFANTLSVTIALRRKRTNGGNSIRAEWSNLAIRESNGWHSHHIYRKTKQQNNTIWLRRI